MSGGKRFNAHEHGRAVHIEQMQRKRYAAMTTEQLVDELARMHDRALAAHFDAAERRMLAALDAFGS